MEKSPCTPGLELVLWGPLCHLQLAPISHFPWNGYVWLGRPGSSGSFRFFPLLLEKQSDAVGSLLGLLWARSSLGVSYAVKVLLTFILFVCVCVYVHTCTVYA